MILWLIPFTHPVISRSVHRDLAAKFGRSEYIGIGMAFLSFIFMPILGFSDSQYSEEQIENVLDL